MQFNPLAPRMKIPVGLAGPHYISRSTTVNNQSTINWYPVVTGPAGETTVVLHPTPGTDLVRSVGTGPHRGSIEHKGKLYFLSGNTLIEMDSNENTTVIPGTTATMFGQVCMCSNGSFGNQILIVDGDDGYVFDGSTLAVIADADFPDDPTSCDYMDGVAIITTADTGVWYISDLNDFTSWTATQFENAERDRDNLVRVYCNNRDIMLLGDYTTEVATNTGASPFPFETYPNGLMDRGCAARFSVAKSDDTVFWLSNDRRGSKNIVKARGVNIGVISNPGMEEQISTYSTVSDAEAFCYTEKGIPFYQITFPTAGKTWICNLAVQDPNYAWSQKVTEFTRHIASTYTYFNNKHYLGAWNSSDVFAFNSDHYTDAGTTIIRERTSQIIASDKKYRLRHYSMELRFEEGVGLVNGQGSSPQVALSWSDDGGRNWSNVRTASIGGIGEYTKRVRFDVLGSARTRQYRVRVSDPVRWILRDAILDVEELAN